MRLPRPDSPEQYGALLARLEKLPPASKRKGYRHYALSDLYFLLRFVLKREDLWEATSIAPPPMGEGAPEGRERAEGPGERALSWDFGLGASRPGGATLSQGERGISGGEEPSSPRRLFCFSRCREVEQSPDGYLDLWARGHYKSTIITFGLTIQEILKNPEIRIGIFSQDHRTARTHLSQIKREFEGNELLKSLFPEILWQKPRGESPLWSRDHGILVRRSGNPKEPTVSSYGLVGGLPVGPHFDLLVYDDTVTKESVRSPRQIRRTTEAWEHSLGLKAEGARIRYIGTRYHLSDTYDEILKRGAAIPRVHPAEVDGEPVLFSSEELLELRKTMGPSTFASQMMQDPRADTHLGFRREWLEKCQYREPPREAREHSNVYFLCDPAHSKKKTSDYTAIIVVALGDDKNYRVLDLVRDRLLLQEREEVLFALHRKWAPVAAVGYEDYGTASDQKYLESRMRERGQYFPIVGLKGRLSKEDRIRRLTPLFEQGRILFPPSLLRTNSEGEMRDLVRDFIEEEYCAFPVGAHDDLLDALSRILDDELRAGFPPDPAEVRRRKHQAQAPPGGWMGR
ncbi:MAG: phage terminase large subunit [Bdellovibrionota bacterium]